jgi:hypothetical protein
MTIEKIFTLFIEICSISISIMSIGGIISSLISAQYLSILVYAMSLSLGIFFHWGCKEMKKIDEE